MHKLKNFVHIHNHTHFSLLDGLSRIDELVKYVKEQEMPAIGLTDHGNMSGAIQLWEKCTKEGVKPLIGCELYVATGDRTVKERIKGKKNYHHFIALAKNEAGYKNLCKLVTRSFTEGFYYKPRVDKSLLVEHCDGLIVTSACLGSEIAQTMMAAGTDAEGVANARPIAQWYLDLFKENYYLELQDHGIPEQRLVNRRIIQLSQAMNIPLVFTNDSHFIKETDFTAHKALTCIAHNKHLHDNDHVYKTDHHVKSVADMGKIIYRYPSELQPIIHSAMERSLEIADQCNFNFKKGQYHFPKFSTPKDKTITEFFKEKVYSGVDKLKESFDQSKLASYSARLIEEMALISKMGFEAYFLLIADVINYARAENIPVGPGRGSVGGSLVAYCLGITEVDPIRFSLLFERFLNAERISMPDIDIDFSARHRQRVIDYVINKYGKDNVAQIATFGTLQAKAAINDMGRILRMPIADTRKLSSAFFGTGNKPMSLQEAIDKVPAYKQIVESNIDSIEKTVIELSLALENTNRNIGTHAAGIIITPKAISNYAPLWYASKTSTTMVGYDMNDLEKIGLVKMDFLGLKTLDVINDAIDLIKEHHQKDVSLQYKTPDDPEVFKHIFACGNTAGIFQFESHGIRQALKAIHAKHFDDIVAMNALYRPGPIDSKMLGTYISRSNSSDWMHESSSDSIHPALNDILRPTLGVIVFQEQVMEVVRFFTGYSLKQADVIRKAMGKKDASLMQDEVTKFIDAGVAQGWPKLDMQDVAEAITKFARYGFNKAHAVMYSMIAYQTAWLKHYYPLEFMCALLTSVSEYNKSDKIVEYISDAIDMKIKILPPDINYSNAFFSIEKNIPNSLRVGLSAIQHIGQPVAEAIINERKTGGQYKSFSEFLHRVNLNSKAVEFLIKAGATESLGGYKSQHFASYPNIATNKRKSKTMKSQQNIFGMVSFDVHNLMQESLVDIPEWDNETLQSYEYEATGMWITNHPIDSVPISCIKDKISDIVRESDLDIEERVFAGTAGNKQYTLTCIVAGITQKAFNNNQQTKIDLEDRSGRITFSHYGPIGNGPSLVKGKYVQLGYNSPIPTLEIGKPYLFTIMQWINSHPVQGIAIKNKLTSITRI